MVSGKSGSESGKNSNTAQQNLVFESAQGEQEIVKKRKNIKKLTNILLLIFLVFALVLSVVSFFVYDVVFWLVVVLALAFYVAMFTTVIVRHELLKYLKNK